MPDLNVEFPKAFDLFMRSPGMSWPEALRQTGESRAPDADRLVTHVTAEAERFDRRAAVRERATILIAAGQTVEEAERNAARAVAYERNEGIEVDLDSMSFGELTEYLKSDPANTTYILGDLAPASDSDEPLTIEQMAASIGAMNDENAPIGVNINRAHERHAANEAASIRERTVEDTYRAMKRLNPDLDDADLRAKAEAAVPAKVAKPAEAAPVGMGSWAEAFAPIKD